MHPEIARELTTQRGREMQASARQATLARAASRARRAMRHGTGVKDGADELAIPAIPDYVDGSFRAAPAAENAGQGSSQPGRASASGRAA
jgi:hypothetical protein